MADQFDFIYEAGATQRFHTIPTITSQNIADHSWHVTMLGHMLYGQDEPGLTMPFLMACLTHDMAECRVGDIPAPAKRNMTAHFHDFRNKWGEMEQELLSDFAMDWEKFLSEEEKRRLKICDALEGMAYCVKERMLGNKVIAHAFMNFQNYVGLLLEDIPEVPLPGEPVTHAHREWDAFNFIQNKWSEANGS
jgi:5'-deoxynucleotidase YfbR-like HD superfamily hydrolase